jgi:hypothetical protein
MSGSEVTMLQYSECAPVGRVEDIRRALVVCVPYEDAVERVRRDLTGIELVLVRQVGEWGPAVKALHIPTAVVVAPEVVGRSGPEMLATAQRQWPGVLTVWAGRYGRVPAPPDVLAGWNVESNGPFEADLGRLSEIALDAHERGAAERDREQELAVELAGRLGLGPRDQRVIVLLTMLAHRATDDELRRVLDRHGDAFNRFCSERLYKKKKVVSLMHAVQLLRSLADRLREADRTPRWVAASRGR